jgi:cell division protein ZipA
MPELRWTLLIIGVLFIAVLAWWERRRPHQASRQAPHISNDTPRSVVSNDPTWGADIEPANSRQLPHVSREPTLTLPEIRTEVRTREPTASRELPIVEISGLEDDSASEEEISEEIEEISEEIAEETADEVEPPAPHIRATDGVSEAEVAEVADVPVTRIAATDVAQANVPKPAVAVPDVAAADDAPASDAADTPAELPPPNLNAVKPIVDWPPEDQRQIVSLRLVARPPDRFRGALVRQALYGEGFVLGEFDIFHKPDAQNRAVLSAASLTKPGTFDLETMDTQRYVGLNLFAVLPGPKPPRKAFEELLLAARMLNERLEGALQDDRGGPLTPMRIQALRDALGVEAKS